MLVKIEAKNIKHSSTLETGWKPSTSHAAEVQRHHYNHRVRKTSFPTVYRNKVQYKKLGAKPCAQFDSICKYFKKEDTRPSCDVRNQEIKVVTVEGRKGQEMGAEASNGPCLGLGGGYIDLLW